MSDMPSPTSQQCSSTPASSLALHPASLNFADASTNASSAGGGRRRLAKRLQAAYRRVSRALARQRQDAPQTSVTSTDFTDASRLAHDEAAEGEEEIRPELLDIDTFSGAGGGESQTAFSASNAEDTTTVVNSMKNSQTATPAEGEEATMTPSATVLGNATDDDAVAKDTGETVDDVDKEIEADTEALPQAENPAQVAQQISAEGGTEVALNFWRRQTDCVDHLLARVVSNRRRVIDNDERALARAQTAWRGLSAFAEGLEGAGMG